MTRTLLAALLLCGTLAPAQTAKPLVFEVATIKPAAPDARGTSINILPGGGFRSTNATLKMLLTTAYDVRDFQISGGPDWMNTYRFDITAKAERSDDPADAAPEPGKINNNQMKTYGERMRERLRGLLADRFQVAIHKETKDAPIYALVVGKNGVKMKVVEDGKDGNRGLRGQPGQLTGMGAPMDLFSNWLSGQLGRPVLDQTGLPGLFDFTLKWTPDMALLDKLGDLPPGVDRPNIDSNGPSIFTAVQEQLGLRLDSRRGAVEIIVIDRAEKPSEN